MVLMHYFFVEAFMIKSSANYFILSSSAEQLKLNIYNELVYNLLYQLLIQKF